MKINKWFSQISKKYFFSVLYMKSLSLLPIKELKPKRPNLAKVRNGSCDEEEEEDDDDE